ncbi:modifier of mdg4-like isoform X5 [Chironomus tepperi]|uniref:modifier of mdg4-like isoform X5 n=1 Tax=Chironomus tepperi TaxID=113505 RepID=UPI00391F257E
MADEEQFSLCWNNFNTNLSAGFHESLCRGDLVDVTLAAEGQLVKAHRLVLSVCSPYFRKMFTQMPANQHAFVFLKDVSSSALKDLIQFMYCGEVNVRQEALPAFISTAEALQIKGLTESNEAVTATGSSSPTKEVITSTPLPDTASIRARGTVRSVSNRPQAFKIESEGSSDEKQTVTLVQNQPVKRIARQSIPTSAPKRVKTQLSQETPDPLDAPDHEIVTPQQLKETTEFIDLPIETTSLNPKTEPEYVEDTQEIETEQDDDNQYVEDVTYGEEKYEESYFTEGDDNKAGVSGFSETYATEGDQSATEAQDYYIDASESVYSFLRGRKGGHHLVYDNYIYRSNFRRHGLEKNVFYFECIWNRNGRCRGRIKTVGDKIYRSNSNVPHNHEPDYVRIQEARQKGLITLKSLSEAAREYEERVQIKVEMIPEMLNECLISPYSNVKTFPN